ncbi:MAG: response regulator [Treponema sp.]|jgi:two-component system response regulator YesN|nr:response regulator [Treponema sp.]
MLKVFLVEDEIVVREGIRNSVAWEKTAYTLAGEAPDGEIALPMIQDIKPDIIITDIRMPFMDGLALSRIVRKTLPWIKIIILSGHDEFEYAREAISIGVEGYLLKPASSDDMLKALDKVALRISEEQAKLRDIENLKEKLRDASSLLRDKWLGDFINGRISGTSALENGKDFGVDLSSRFYIACAIAIKPSRGETARQGDAGPLAAAFIIKSITEHYSSCVFFKESGALFALIVKGDAASAAEETAYAIAQAVIYEVQRDTGCGVAVGIGPGVERAGEVPASFKAALAAAKSFIEKSQFKIADAENIAGSAAPLPGLPGTVPYKDAHFSGINGDFMFTKLKYAAKGDIDSILEEYVGMLGNSFDENPMFAYLVIGEIIMTVSRIVEVLGGDINIISPFALTQHEVSELASSKETLLEKLRSLLNAVIEWRDAHSGGRYQAVIMKAREYIDINYTSGEISLHSTANFVGISPNHLSAVFAQETGENFIDYLTRVRIEKAKFLLKNTAMKSADIAYETGFNDPHYFSYIFKKNAGMSPREYRNTGK